MQKSCVAALAMQGRAGKLDGSTLNAIAPWHQPDQLARRIFCMLPGNTLLLWLNFLVFSCVNTDNNAGSRQTDAMWEPLPPWISAQYVDAVHGIMRSGSQAAGSGAAVPRSNIARPVGGGLHAAAQKVFIEELILLMAGLSPWELMLRRSLHVGRLRRRSHGRFWAGPLSAL
ncbi:hypothetical protein Efla_007050 [Eimeria flavescens]